MATSNRRGFMKTGVGLAGAATLTAAGYARAGGANERFTVALIGCGGMGNNHLRTLGGQKDVTVAYVCDPDTARQATSATIVEKSTGRAPQTLADMRKVFGDKRV